jgi:Fur family ferric uptake transcriptional regulator
MIASTQTNHPIADAKDSAKIGELVDQACTRLRQGGLRITEPRKAILRALARREQPASIEQLHADLADTSCDLVTVYRCLAAFQELGFVRRSYFENGTSLYQLQLDGGAAYHVVTRDGGVIEQIDAALAAELKLAVNKVEEQLKARGYTGVSHLVEFFANAPRVAHAAQPPAAAGAAPTRAQTPANHARP